MAWVHVVAEESTDHAEEDDSEAGGISHGQIVGKMPKVEDGKLSVPEGMPFVVLLCLVLMAGPGSKNGAVRKETVEIIPLEEA